MDNFTIGRGFSGTQVAVVGAGRRDTSNSVVPYIQLNRTNNKDTLKILINGIEHDQNADITPDIDG